MAADVSDTGFLQQGHDLFERAFFGVRLLRLLVDARVAVLAAIKRPYDAVDHVVAAAPREADPVFVDASLAEAAHHRTQLLRRGADCVEKITNRGAHRVRTHTFV